MTAEIVTFNGRTTADHRPDDILECAKGEGFDVALVIGFIQGQPIDVRASTANVEQVVFLLEWAKRFMLDQVVAQTGADG